MFHVKQVAVRNSELIDAASCLRRYFYTWVKGYRPKKTDSKLQTGSLVHKFWEVYESIIADTHIPEIHRAGLAESNAFQAMDTLYTEFKAKLLVSDVEGHDKADKAYLLARGMAEGYTRWRPESGLTPLFQTEAEFEQPLGGVFGVNVTLKGTMDGLARDDIEEIILREYKTCKSIADKKKSYRLDKQIRRYALALRLAGIPVSTVQVVLAAKVLPLADEDYIISKGIITRDKSKWNKATYEQALRVAEIGKFAEENAKNGLTESGFHDILNMLRDRDNPFFYVYPVYLDEVELSQTHNETLMEGYRIAETHALAEQVGDVVWTRNQGIMAMNCKGCPVRDLCEPDFKGVDISLILQEHFDVVDPSAIMEEDEEDEEDVSD